MKKGDRVFYKMKPAIVEKGVGGNDFIIRMDDGGKRFVVSGKNLVEYEVVESEGEKVIIDAPVPVPAPSNDEEVAEVLKGEGLEVVEGADAVKKAIAETPVEEEEEPEPSKPQLAKVKFEKMGKKELYNLAKMYDVAGRSGMDVDQLRESVAEHLDLV